MKKLLYVGSYDDSRTKVYENSLKRNAKFGYDIISWNDFLKLNELDKKNIIRFSSPWFEKELKDKLLNSKEVSNLGDNIKNYGLGVDKINENYYNMLSIAENLTKKNLVLNSPKSLKIMRDKEKFADLLNSDNTIRTPQYYNINFLSDILILIEDKKNIFIKPKSGSLGEGLSLFSIDKNKGYSYRIINGKEDEIYYGENAINKLEKIVFDYNQFIFQDYIKLAKINGSPFDMRVLKNLDTNSLFPYLRISKNNSLGTNVSLGADISKDILNYIPKKSLEESLYLVEKTSKIIGSDIFGADIVFDESYTPYVLEANAFPGISGPLNFGYNLYDVEINKINKKYI